MRAGRREPATLAAKSAGACRNVSDLMPHVMPNLGRSPAGSKSPDQCDPPADDGPSQKEIHKKNTSSTGPRPENQRDDGGQKIKKRHKNQKLHGLPPQPDFDSRHTAPHNLDTQRNARLFPPKQFCSFPPSRTHADSLFKAFPSVTFICSHASSCGTEYVGESSINGRRVRPPRPRAISSG